MRPLNTGYVSTGHLLADRDKSEHFKRLRHFCTLIFCNLDEDAIHKSSGFWRYDQFFASVDVGVDSFAKFVGGILRKHDTNEFELQLLVEKLAWDLIKYDYDHLNCPKITRKDVLFRLFCVFNRLCSTKSLPMLLPEKAARFLLTEMGVASQSVRASGVRGPLTLSRFFQLVCDRKDEVSVKGVKRLYDEFVRDVIREGRVRYRPQGAGQERVRTFTVTSRQLVVRDDAEGAIGTDALDQPQRTEPTGKVLHRLPLVELETRVVKGGLLTGSSKMFLQVLAPGGKKSRKRSAVLELVFDANKDQLEMYAWSQAVQEGVYATQANTSRLDKLYHRLGLGAESGLTVLVEADGRRRISAPESPPGFKPDDLKKNSNGNSNTESGVESASSSPGAIRPRAVTKGVFRLEQMGRSISETQLRVRQPSGRSAASAGEAATVKAAMSTTVIAVTSDDDSNAVDKGDRKARRKKKRAEEVGVQLISSGDNVTTVVVTTKAPKPVEKRRTKAAAAARNGNGRPLSDLPKSFTARVSSSEISLDSLEEKDEGTKEEEATSNGKGGGSDEGIWINDKNPSPKITRVP